MNKHLHSDTAAQALEKKREEDLAEEQSRVYSVEAMLALRADNKTRPPNMALLDFPHKKRKGEFRREPISEIDKFNQSVGQIRILLNKLSHGNFETIEGKLLKDFEYTPSLLYELMKIIFMKATTESSFMEIYVRLCVTLFKKFQDKDNVEMNFRKLLLTRCEKQFYKMLKVEQEERRSRRASMEEAQLTRQVGNETGGSDFNKQMLAIFDISEIKKRQQDQMFGNMHLIVELYKYQQIKSGILTHCIDDMFEEVNSQNVEILCKMLMKLAAHVIKTSREMREAKQAPRSKNALIDLEWLDATLARLFKQRENKELDSRIRFQIQDLIDAYEKDWKFEIYQCRQAKTDTDGFQKKYVPKSALHPVESKGGKNRSRKNSSVSQERKMGYWQPKKVMAEDRPKPPASNNIYSLLSNLKPDQEARNPSDELSHSDDEDAMKLVDRKISINKMNVTGLDFEKYNDLKPTPEIKRKITNLCFEYLELGDNAHATGEFEAIITETGLQRFVFVGYILNNALSMNSEGWDAISSLVIDHFWKERKLFEGTDLIEG